MLNWIFSALGRLLWWVIRQVARLLAYLAVQAFLHPRTTATASAAAASVAWLGWQTCAIIAGSTFISLSTWKAAHPATFAATVATWTRTWWHKWWIYRRLWSDVFTRCELTVSGRKGEAFLPKCKAVTSTPYWDRVTVEMQIGQSVTPFQQRADDLRIAFKAERIVIKEMKPRLLELSLMRQDPLLQAVPATPIPASVEAIDWRRIPVGIDEFGKPYTVSLLGGNTSAAGTMGAGKAGLEWNILRAVAPAFPAGLVRAIFIDPKGKELRQGRALVADDDYAVTDEQTLALLERLVGELAAANDADGDTGERDFTPRKGRPLTLIFIDELAPLLKYWPRRIRDKIEDALGIILTQGRAAGFIVIGCIQEPTKDVFQVRDLFARRIALRLPTESHTEAALVENAVDYGALCHQIPESLPGVLFSLQDGARSTVRARLGHVRDEDIAELVAYVEASQKVIELPARSGKANVAA
jgi:DNA segregation ATPase FtsK/SpoIIIE, S-DNA-T family